MTEPVALDAETPARVPLAELVGTKLGDYRIERVLGYGSMGVVFEATHEQLGRRVALKALPPGLGATEKAIQRFLREAQAVAQLSHENIVPIYEISRSDTIHYYAMQFLEGEPLDRVIKRGPLDPREAAQLALTAARAIHFAHQRGIIHRDIKPANLIVVTGGKLVLTDFGLARPEQGSGITDSGAMVGTPLYMSPEQVRAKRGGVDRRTDVYSLGATLYEMLTGRPPYPGDSTQEILQAILDQEPRHPRVYISAIPADLETVVMKTLEKEPKRRYQSALELAQDLERFLEGEPILARGTSIVGRSWRRLRKHKTIAVLSVAIALVVLGFSSLLKINRDTRIARELTIEMNAARSAFTDANYLSSAEKFEEVLRKHPQNMEARLGRARALCFLGQDWEAENEKAKTETRPPLATQFGSVDKLYAIVLEDVTAVSQAQPENALALFYRGFLRWRSREKLERESGAEDLFKAETKGGEDWETQVELATFRFGLAKEPKRNADQRSELLQQALTNASRAVSLLDLHSRSGGSAAPRHVMRVYQLRGDIYSELYELGGNVPEYLELAGTDFRRARQTGIEDPRLDTQISKIEADLEGNRSKKAKESVLALARPDARGASDVTRDVLAKFGVTERSERSEFLASLLLKGGDLLAAGWQQTDGIRTDFVNKFVNPYLPDDLTVSDEERQDAAIAAAAARRILQSGLQRNNLPPSEQQKARDFLLRAVEKNPRNAQYFVDLALVEQGLGELEPARAHLEEATKIAPSNPLFSHQLALVCEQLSKPADALVHARKTAELAPDSADFLADHARIALAAAEAESDEAKRKAPLEEARAAVARLAGLAPDHAALAGLRERIAPPPVRSE